MLGGAFHLNPEIRLIPQETGGTVLVPHPLKVFRVNPAAFDLLSRTRTGLSAAGYFQGLNAEETQKAMSFFDSSSQAGLVEWTPDPDYLPSVSIILPVYNRETEIADCLESLIALDYPAERLEIIVVDDGSTDGTVGVVCGFPVRLLVLPHNQGPSAARNAGVREARGDIIAFIDSDCLADPTWLKELVPYFQDPRLGIIGGRVGSYYHKTWLDRFEDIHSALDLGPKKLLGTSQASDIYVPSCNMLVRHEVYLQVAGLDEGLRVGEDVDLCWRVKERGFRILYTPKGRVAHKHRNRLWPAFWRRFEYGTAEPGLYARHVGVKKRFPWQPGGLAFSLLGLLFLFRPSLFPVLAAALVFLIEILLKQRAARLKTGIRLPWPWVATGTLKAHFHLAYWLAYYVTRYYLLLLVGGAVLFPAAAVPAAAVSLFPAVTEYFAKKPDLPLPVFILFYWLEKGFYQSGVFRSCFKENSWRSHKWTFGRIGVLKTPSRPW